MKKLIKISGELDEKGSTANKLSVLVANENTKRAKNGLEQTNLTEYISDALDAHVKLILIE